MDLWVKNQSKTGLYKVNNVVVDTVTNAIVTRLGDEDEWLGFYESKERTLEVLGEIQKLLIENMVVFKNYDVPDYKSLKTEIDYARKYGFFDVNSHPQVDMWQPDYVVFEKPEE